MLFVIDDEVLETRCDGMILVLDVNLERAQRGMTNVSTPHHLAIILRPQRDVTAIMQRVEAISRLHKFLNSGALLLRHPRLRFGRRKFGLVFKPLFISRVCIRAKISIRPDHSITKDQQQLIVLQQLAREGSVLNRVVSLQLKRAENLVHADSNVVGVVVAIAHKGKDFRLAWRLPGTLGCEERTGGKPAADSSPSRNSFGSLVHV